METVYLNSHGAKKCQLRDLSKQEFLALRELCRMSKNLYNVFPELLVGKELKEVRILPKYNARYGDEIPVYNPDNPQKYTFSGQRIKRGLYRTKSGHLVNADRNRTANIGKKSSRDGFTGVGRGCLAQPLTVKISL